MNTLTIGKNIKRLRDERRITQQQLADAVGISYQAVSKWETGTTVPDVAVLPEIAEYFDVTIDSLFQPNFTVYRNKAERLMAIYESDRDNSEAFEKAESEFTKLLTGNSYENEDLTNYAYLNDCRARHYNAVSEQYYLDAIERGSKIRDSAYNKVQRQYILFLSRLGRNDENISRHTRILKEEPDNVMNYSSLVCAYLCAHMFEDAYEIADNGLQKFPEDALLLTFAGDVCKRLGKFDKAIEYWDHSFEIDPEMIDTRYSLASYLSEQQQYHEAEKVWDQIIQWNECRGFYVENKWAKSELDKVKEAMKSTSDEMLR